MYIWTRNAARAASTETLTQYADDMNPPLPAGGDSTTLGSGADEQIKILGPYERKNEFKGMTEGAIGYFAKADRTVWICGWSFATNSWEDIGEVQGVSSGKCLHTHTYVGLCFK